MSIGWPEGIVLAIFFLGLGVALAKDGEPRAPYSFGGALISTAITLSLLYWGGFFA